MAKSKKRKRKQNNASSGSKNWAVKLMCIILAALMALGVVSSLIYYAIDAIRTKRAAKQNANTDYTYPVEIYETEPPATDEIIIDDPIEVDITTSPEDVTPTDGVTSEPESQPVTEQESSETPVTDSVPDDSSFSNQGW